MRSPTDEEVAVALGAVANLREDGRWHWGGGTHHSDEDSRALVRMCLMLGVKVTDVGTIELMTTIVHQIALTQERVARLEDHVLRGRG